MSEHQKISEPSISESKSSSPERQISAPNNIKSNTTLQFAKMNVNSLSYGDVMQLQRNIGNQAVLQLLSNSGKNTSNTGEPLIQKKENKTGLPDNLKSGVENISGISMDDVRVHYNSSKPTQLQALAYTNGTDIHVAPGQEKHLAHEAWHVVQQRQNRVRPTETVGSLPINDSPQLEKEADIMGGEALQLKSGPKQFKKEEMNSNVIQRVAAPPQVRQQSGGTCGCYSLWMAYESLYGENPDAINAILEAGQYAGSQFGENFTYDQLNSLVSNFNNITRKKYNLETINITRNEFKSSKEFVDQLKSTGNLPVMIAYDFSLLYGKKSEGSNAAHWSLISNIDIQADEITISNPHGNVKSFPTSEVYGANDNLIGGFDAREFAQGILNNKQETLWNWYTDPSISDFANGMNIPYNQAKEKLELWAGFKDGSTQIATDLKGYFVVVSK